MPSSARTCTDSGARYCLQATGLARRLQDPRVAVPVGATTVLGATALYNYHATLEVRALASRMPLLPAWLL